MLCVLQDIVDPIIDEQLANFVVNSHMRSHPSAGASAAIAMDDNTIVSEDNTDDPVLQNAAYLDDGPPLIEQALLKKYITYAKTYTHPVLQV